MPVCVDFAELTCYPIRPISYLTDLNMKPNFFLYGLALCLAGCGGEPQVRVYKELNENPSGSSGAPKSAGKPPSTLPNLSGLPSTPADVQWTLPEGWTQATHNSSFRLATFTVDQEGQQAEISLSRLGGGGTVEGNISRWAEQIHPENPPEPETVARFAEEKTERLETEGGAQAILMDLTSFAKPDAEAESMLAAIVRTAGTDTIFVKMTGPKPLLASEAERFRAFTRSLR